MASQHAMRLVRVVAVVSFMSGLAASPCLAQTIRGTVTGTVTDSTGGVLPGATMTLTNVATGIATSAVTNQQGGYTIPLLPPGTYQAVLELQGFKKYVREGIVVEIAQIATAHSVNGMPWSGNNYLLDGVVNNEPLNAYINITPPLEAIQEFKVQTNNPTAEFSVFGGAAVNLSIRSGTNQLQLGFRFLF